MKKKFCLIISFVKLLYKWAGKIDKLFKGLQIRRLEIRIDLY